MSFLNPVNEPVLRFSSTDADAPQINYNARTAGDVKAVLKACLVTGYGSVASAGWSIVNEVNHVAEFVSPSAAMSDYRLGIDDTSASSTTWYYRYQNVRTNPTKNAVNRSVSFINNTSALNGWDLFVTARGLYFVESFLHTTSNAITSRLLWFGQLKSALIGNNGVNISLFATGYNSPNATPTDIFTNSANTHSRLEGYQNLSFASANIDFFKNLTFLTGVSAIDLVSDLYLTSNSTAIAKQPGIMLEAPRDIAQAQSGVTVSGHYRVLTGRGVSTADMPNYNKPFLIALDTWEF